MELVKISRENRATFHGISKLYLARDETILLKDSQGKICRITSEGKILSYFECKTTPRQLWSPADLAWDNSYNLYVYDAANKALMKYNSDGKLDSTFDLSQHFKWGVTRMRLDRKDNICFLTGDLQSNKIVRFKLSDMF